MRSDVRLVRLGDLLEITSSKRVHMADYVAYGIPFYRSKEIIERSKGNQISTELFIAPAQFGVIKEKFGSPSEGDILLTSVGTLGVPYVVKGEGDFYFKDGNLTWMRNFTDQINSQFLYYWLTSAETQQKLDQISIGSTQKALTISALKSLEISLPSRLMQDRTVEILDVISNRSALLRETNSTLEAIAQALFKSWFVDFDPVRAKQSGKKPEGMDETTASLFPESFEQSELGKIPKGWKLTPFGDLLNLTIGGDWGDDFSNEQNNIRVAIIRGTDIPNLKSCINNAVPIRYTSQKKLDTRKLKDGDIVIEVSGGTKNQPTGRSLYISNSLIKQFDCPVAPASFCRLMRPKTSELGILLAQHLTYIYEQGDTWEYQIQSTGIANFQTTYFLKKELVTVPSTEILNKFSEIIQPLIHSTQLSKIQHLTKLRDTLLPQLISGKIRLPKIEEINNKTKVNA
jgi:type I restriction enzyme S subunit